MFAISGIKVNGKSYSWWILVKTIVTSALITLLAPPRYKSKTRLDPFCPFLRSLPFPPLSFPERNDPLIPPVPRSNLNAQWGRLQKQKFNENNIMGKRDGEHIKEKYEPWTKGEEGLANSSQLLSLKCTWSVLLCLLMSNPLLRVYLRCITLGFILKIIYLDILSWVYRDKCRYTKCFLQHNSAIEGRKASEL